MDSSNDDGITLRDRLLQVYNSSGIYDNRLDLPIIPRELEYIMGWFWEIRNAVGGNGFGANPISFCEMKAYSELYDISLSAWEVYMLRRLDMEFIKFSNERSHKKTQQMKATSQAKKVKN